MCNYKRHELGSSVRDITGNTGGIVHDPAASQSGRVNNLEYNASLFKAYKDRNVRSASIRNKVKSEELDPLPLSKVDQGPMCLAWHTKGQCNGACPRKGDHVGYSKGEYGDLLEWCKKNYPISE